MASPVDYYVLTQLLVDDVSFPDGTQRLGQLGGGTYAVAGMRVWSESVGFCCALGSDYEGQLDGWFLRHRVQVTGRRHPKRCTRARLNYFPDGEREEILLPGYATHHETQPLVSEIPPAYARSKGMYFFKDCEEEFWDELVPFLRGGSAVSCWEVFGATAAPENRDVIAGYLREVDLFSLNLTEGRRLTGLAQPEAVMRDLLRLGAKNVILRMGANGALVSSGNEIWHIPAQETDVVDVTGGGNSSTGGFVVGYCESGGSVVEAGLYAAVSASYILRQFGVPPEIDEAMTSQAKTLRDALRSRVSRLN